MLQSLFPTEGHRLEVLDISSERESLNQVLDVYQKVPWRVSKVMRRKNWLRVTRKDGINVFEFVIEDPDRAFEAIRDTPGLFSVGISPEKPLSAYGARYTRNLDVFLTAGFVWNDTGGVKSELVSGSPGEVGATYTYSFPLSESKKSSIMVTSEIASLYADGERKELILRSKNTSSPYPLPNMLCFFCGAPEFPIEETETKFELYKTNHWTGDWIFKLSHNGPSPTNHAEIEGCCNLCCFFTGFGIVCPCALPIIPCILYDEFCLLSKPVGDHMERLREYLNTYSREQYETASPQTQQMDYAYAIPIEGEGVQGEIAQELGELDRLYHSGAITLQEYESEEKKINSR